MKQEKEFYAFISYKREDEKWAKWLQDKLEHYRFPTNLNGRTDLPKNIRPTFRDVTDLTSGLLAEEINNALRNSEWLIVICSPRSAQSPWVCKEAQTFIDLGRADHIIPFVIEGKPFSDDISTECYPEALLNLTGSNELLAANINEMGRDAAAIKVVARMFSLRFDALWQRYEREQRRKRWVWIGGLIIIALFGFCIGGYFVRQNSIIERQNERLLQDSITMANHLFKIKNDSIMLSVQNDSITLQNYLILSQRDSIEHSMQQLQLSNNLLAEERDNVLKINGALKLSNAKIRSENALSLLREGNLVGAKDVISQICNDEYVKELVQIPEIEFTLRKVYRELTREGIRHLYSLDYLGKVSLVKFSNNGNKIYVITNTLSEYDASSGELIAQFNIDFETDRDEINISAFDEVNGEVYYSIDNKVYVKKIYSVANDKRVFEFPEHIYNMIVSPTFDYIACEFINDVDCQSVCRIIQLSDKQNNNYVIPSCENIYCFSPDGKKIFTEIDDKYCIYNLNTKNIEQIVAYDYYIQEAHFSNDCSKILIQSEGNNKISLDIYNIESGELVEFGEKISGDRLSICRLKENPLQNRIIVGDYYGNLKVYDTEFLSYYNIVKNKMRIKGRLIDNLFGHREAIRLIEFNNKGTKMLTTSNGKICVWGFSIKEELSKYTSKADYVASSGKSYVKINNRTAQLYDMTSNKAIGNPLFVNDSDFNSRYRIKHISRNNEIVVATKDSSVCVFWPNKNRFFTIPFGCYEYSLKLSIDEEGKILAIYDDLNGNKNNSSMKIFDLNNNTLLARDETVHCQAMAMNPKGDELAVSSFGNDIFIYNTTSLVRKKELPRIHNDYISSLCYSSNGKYLISVSWDRKVCMWDTQKGALVKTFKGAERELWSCSISSDNAYISASTDRDSKSKIRTYIWSVETGKIVEVLEEEDIFLFCQDVSNKFVSTPLANNYFCSFPSLAELISFFKIKPVGGIKNHLIY